MDEKKTRKNPENALPTYNSWKELPHVPVSLGIMGSIGATGQWRLFRPEISQEKCNRCGLCYLYCPEGTVLFKNAPAPAINLTYCKGCGICASECPRKAIAMKPESTDRKKGSNE